MENGLKKKPTEKWQDSICISENGKGRSWPSFRIPDDIDTPYLT